MRIAPDLDAAVAKLAGGWRWPDVAQLTLFVMTEQAASLCQAHLQGPSGWRLGAATPTVAAMALMTWAYLAHGRLAFRFHPGAQTLIGFTPFLLLSWGCLDLSALTSRLAPTFALAAAVLIAGFKFILARQWVWRPTPSASSQ